MIHSINSYNSNTVYFQGLNKKIANKPVKINPSINDSVKEPLSRSLGYKAMFIAGLLLVGYGSYCYRNIQENDKKNINPITNTLPENGKFKTQAEAISYARNRVLDALHSPCPVERVVVIDNTSNKIIAENDGKAADVIANISEEQQRNITQGVIIVHGHSGDRNASLTPPLGTSDFLSLVNNPFVSNIIAFNSVGEYSVLSKSADFKPLSDEVCQRVIKETETDLAVKTFEHTDKFYYDKLMSKYKNAKSEAERDAAYEIFNDNVKDMTGKDYYIKELHKYWEQNAASLGLIYRTNFKK